MIITEFVDVKIVPKTYKHYKDLGYVVKSLGVITVQVKDLSKGSHVEIYIKCDYCEKIIKKQYKTIMTERDKSIIKKDCCKNCSPIKQEEIQMLLYGVKNPMQREEISLLLDERMVEKYGFKRQSQTLEYKIQNQKYWENISEEEIQRITEKRTITCLKRYGVGSFLQTPVAREKRKEAGGYFQISSQQQKIYDYIKEKYSKSVLNYNFNPFILDIAILGENFNIDVEYDGWHWHNDEKDSLRNEIVKSRGWKILRIKSSNKIPNMDEVFSKIENLLNTETIYDEIILDDWGEYKKKGKINERFINNATEA